MPAAPIPQNELKRLQALRSYELLDTPAEQSFDDFAKLASFICGTPIAVMSLIDEDRQWFKAKVGMEPSQTPRDMAFCAYTILESKVLIVEDAQKDARFSDNPLVTGNPNIRFYAGAPLIDRDGFGLGSLCVIDTKPHQLSEGQTAALEALARQVVQQCEFRRVSSQLAEAFANVKILQGLLPICCHCKSVRNDEGYWRSVEDYLSSHSEAGFSHGICPVCMKTHFPEIYASFVAQGLIKPE